VPFILGSIEQSKGREMMTGSRWTRKVLRRILEFRREPIFDEVSEQLIVELYSK